MEYIAQKAQLERYNLDDVSSTYANDVIQLFSKDVVCERIGHDVAKIISDHSYRRRESNKKYSNPKGGLGLEYFEKELPKELKKIGREDIWQKYSSQIIYIAQCPHLTSLPKVLSCNPIYGQIQREQISLNRGVLSSMEKVKDDKWYESKLLKFEEGILQLSVDDIFKLRNSPEFKNFRNEIKKFNGTQESLDNISQTLAIYKDRIDAHIVDKFDYLKESTKQKREKIQMLEILDKTSTYGGLILGTLGIATVSFLGMNPLSLGLGIMSFVISPILEKEKEKQRMITETAKEQINEDYTKSDSQKIDSDRLI